MSDNAEEDGESVVLRFGSLPNGVEAGATTSATVTLVDAGAHAVNTAPTGSPSITGTAQVDETLTASVSGIADADGTESATFTYQWVSNNGTSDSDINDATKSTYTVVAADVGKTIKVRVTFTDDGGTEESLVSAATDAVTARSEPVVDATPTISIAGGSGKEGENDAIEFSVTLDEAASGTVTVDYETSDGSAEAGADYSAASGTLSFSAGATRKTISVAISNDSVSENDETFTVTLSNASGGDLGTSEATGTIRNRAVTPVTASFSGMPNEHEGDGSEFTFDLGFNQNVKAGFRRIRDKAFTVSGGDIKKAQRKTQGSNQNWKITVEPDGNSEITITLPETTDCDDDGAICTEEGGMLNHSTSDTVLGPVGISIADAEVEEGANAVLVFAVALSRAASNQMTVDYATSDGTATAGADYTSASGTLTINAGSSSATIEVAVIDDEHNEGSEAFTLTLSNASSGDLTNASATGTITNHDALPKALIARFGRTAAVHIVDQVEERVNAPRAPGFDGRVAGRQINRDMGQQFALDFLQQLGGGYGQQQGQPRARMTATGANDPRFGNGGMTSSFGPQGAIGGAMDPSTSMQGLHPGQSYDQGMGMGLGSDRLLQGSSFALNRATSSGGILSFWSRSAQSQFYGQDGALALNGGRPDLDVRRRLLQGPDGHRRVAVAQPGARKVRRRRQRTGQLRGDRAVPVDRLQGVRARHGLDRCRLRRWRPDAQPRRWSTDRDRAVDGDGGRRRPRADPRGRRRLRPRVQGRHAMGRNANEGGERTGGQPRLDHRGGEPAAHRARGLAEHDDRETHGPDAERRDRHPPGRR